MTKAGEEIYRTLGNEVRLSIANLLLRKGELSCQELQRHFSLSQPTMSHHFTKLINTGIIQVRKEGASHYYSLNQKLLNQHGIYLSEGR